MSLWIALNLSSRTRTLRNEYESSAKTRVTKLLCHFRVLQNAEDDRAEKAKKKLVAISLSVHFPENNWASRLFQSSFKLLSVRAARGIAIRNAFAKSMLTWKNCRAIFALRCSKSNERSQQGGTKRSRQMPRNNLHCRATCVRAAFQTSSRGNWMAAW